MKKLTWFEWLIVLIFPFLMVLSAFHVSFLAPISVWQLILVFLAFVAYYFYVNWVQKIFGESEPWVPLEPQLPIDGREEKEDGVITDGFE